MKRLFVICLFVLASCGLNSSEPVLGVYDLNTNTVTSDSPSGCAEGLAAPMVVELVKENNVYNLYICGALGSFCDTNKHLYATSTDGFAFTISALFEGSFEIVYNTILNHTTITGTGTTSVPGYCTWQTSFNGILR